MSYLNVRKMVLVCVCLLLAVELQACAPFANGLAYGVGYNAGAYGYGVGYGAGYGYGTGYGYHPSTGQPVTYAEMQTGNGSPPGCYSGNGYGGFGGYYCTGGPPVPSQLSGYVPPPGAPGSGYNWVPPR